jgi:hypothetical protein
MSGVTGILMDFGIEILSPNVRRGFVICSVNHVSLESSNKEDEMGGVCSNYGRKEKSYQVLVEKRQGMRSLGRLRHGWKDDTKACFK